MASNVARNFRSGFGHYTEEDLAQEGVVFALEVLEKTDRYDPSRPLENFLYVHIKNRIHNLKRKHFMRTEAPCSCCEAFGQPADPCRKWIDWHARNESKQNLMRPVDVSSVPFDGERNMAVGATAEGEVQLREILDRLDRELPGEVRSDYLRMRAGVSISKGRRQRVREAVLAVVGDDFWGGE